MVILSFGRMRMGGMESGRRDEKGAAGEGEVVNRRYNALASASSSW